MFLLEDECNSELRELSTPLTIKPSKQENGHDTFPPNATWLLDRNYGINVVLRGKTRPRMNKQEDKSQAY
jgi:hypothetical protein